jgi:hypothetical protein
MYCQTKMKLAQTNLSELEAESQRDSGLQPKVARHALPWVNVACNVSNPNGVVALARPTVAQPRWGCGDFSRLTQGSSSLATLGWRTQSRWDWPQTSLSGLANGGLAVAPASWSAPGLWRFSRAGRKAAAGGRTPKPRGISDAASGSSRRDKNVAWNDEIGEHTLHRSTRHFSGVWFAAARRKLRDPIFIANKKTKLEGRGQRRDAVGGTRDACAPKTLFPPRVRTGS